MELANIINELNNLDTNQLRVLNTAVCDRMNIIRNRDAALNRRVLRSGDKVSWNGRNGYTEGVIVRVKRKKAICDVGSGRNWDVPLSMLKAI